jgi:hypothetical protein
VIGQVGVREWGTWALGRSAGVGTGARLAARQELVTVFFGLWLMVGLFVDGWAHNNLAELETFFTPWHALFYSGFTWSAAWVGWVALRSGALERGPRALPLGYGGAVAGVALFGLGGLGDMTWHSLLGIEQGIEALFSPTHLLLFLGALLILSAPFRAAWQADPPGTAPTYRALLPVVASLTLTATLFAFMLMFFAAFGTDGAVRPVVDFAEGLDPDGASSYWMQVSTIGAVFTTTVVLVAPLLLTARRWQPPAGTATTLFTTVAVLTGALDEYATPLFVAAAVVAGVVSDVLLRALRPGPSRPGASWALGALVPLVVWSLWFGAVALSGGVGWAAEMWTGTILWSSVLGATLALLMAPPAGAPAGAPAALLPPQRAAVSPARDGARPATPRRARTGRRR